MPLAEDVVVIRPDFSRFSSELASGLANLPAAEIKLEADLKGLGSDLVERISDAASEAGAVFAEALVSAISAASIPPIELSADTGALAESLSGFAPDAVDIAVSAETDAATADIEALFASLSAEAATIELDADGAAALSAIADVVDSIPGVDIELSVEPSQLITGISDAAGSVEPIEVPIVADTSDLDGAIADASARAASVKLPSSATDPAAPEEGGSQLDFLATLRTASSGAEQAVQSLGKAVGLTNPQIAAAAAVAAGAAVAVGAYREAAKVAAEAAAVFGDSVGELEDVSVGDLTGSLESVGAALAIDDEEIKKVDTSLGRLFDGIGLGAKASVEEIADLGAQIGAIAQDTGKSADEVLAKLETAIKRGGAAGERGLAELGIKVELDGLDLEQRKAELVAKFDEAGAEAAARVADRVENGDLGIEAVKVKLGNLAETIGEPLANVGQKFATGFAGAFEAVEPIVSEVFKVLTKFLDSPFSGAEQFAQLGELLASARPAAEALANIIDKIATAAASAANVIGDVASGIAEFAADTAVESLRSIGRFIADIAEHLPGIDFGEAFGTLGDFASGVAEKIGTVVGVIRDALPAAIAQFKESLQSAIDVADRVAGPFINFPDDVFNAKGKGIVDTFNRIKDAATSVADASVTMKVDVSTEEIDSALSAAQSALGESALDNIEVKFGVDIDTTALDTIDAKIAAVGQGIAASVAQNFPDLGETFKELFSQDGIQSIDEFIAEAQKRAGDFAQFGARIKELTAAGFGDLAGFLAQQGPIASEALGQLFDGTGQVIEGKARQLSDGINSSLATTFQGLGDLAKAGISGVQEALGGAVGAEIAVKLGLDQSEVVTDFAAVKAQFQADPILAKVSADIDPGALAQLQTELGAAAIEFDARVKTDPAGAAANLQGEIQAALDSLPAGTFKTTADREAAKQSLTEAITSATQSAPPAEIKTKTGVPDTSSLATVAQTPIEIPVRFSIRDRGRFGAEDFGALQSEQVITAKVEGGGEVEKLREQIDGLKDRTVSVKVDTGQAVDNTRAVGTALDGLKDKRVEVTSTASAAMSGVKNLASAIDALHDKSVTITVNKVGDASATGASKGGIFDAVKGGVFVNLAEGGFREGVITTDPRYRAQMEAYIRQLGFGSVLDAPVSARPPTSLNLSGAIGGGNIDLYPQGRAAASSFARGVAAGVAESAGGLLSGGKVGPAEVGYDAGFEAASSIAEAIKEATPAVEAASAALASAVTTNVGGPTGPVATAFNSLAARAKAAGVTIYDTANEMAAKLGVKIGYDLTGVGRPGEFAYSATATDLAAALKIDPGGYQYRLPGGGVGRSISTTDADLARLILGTTESARQVGIGNPNNALRDAEIAAQNLGAAVRSGFRDGLGDGYGAGTSYARQAVSGVKDYWGIASPSKVAADIGRNVGDGFNQGVAATILPNAGIDLGGALRVLAPDTSRLATNVPFTSENGSTATSDVAVLGRSLLEFEDGTSTTVETIRALGDTAKETADLTGLFQGHVDAAAATVVAFDAAGTTASVALQHMEASVRGLSVGILEVSSVLAESAARVAAAGQNTYDAVRSAGRAGGDELAAIASEYGGSIGDVIDANDLWLVATGNIAASATTSTKALDFFAQTTGQSVGGVLDDLNERGQSATEALIDFERWVTAASGGQPIPNATGGYYPARAGGYLLRAGEAGYDEAVVTADPRYRSMQLDRLERLGLVAAPSTSNPLAGSSSGSGASRNEVRVEQTIVTPYADPGLVADEVTARLSRFIRGLS